MADKTLPRLILARGEYDDVLEGAVDGVPAIGVHVAGSAATPATPPSFAEIIKADFSRLHRIEALHSEDDLGIMSAIQRFIHATTATLPRQCASAGFLFATGDIIAQQVVEKRGRQHDPIRTARLAAYGGLIFSPIAAFWLGKVLERVPYKGFQGALVKVGLDQSIAAPALLGVFFTTTTLMEGKNMDAVRAKLKQSYWSTLLTSWSVWIPVQTINMAFVPPQQRLLFINVVSIFWNTFLALVAGSSGAPAAKNASPDDEYGLREYIPSKAAVGDAVENAVDAVKGHAGGKSALQSSLLPFAHARGTVDAGARPLPAGNDVAAALREIKAHKVW